MSTWHVLRHSKTGRNRTWTPTKLLFRFDRNKDGIQLYVTDLLSIWTDGFWPRKAMSEEARRIGCSIDPSEDESQFEVLISKLRDGLVGSNGGTCKMGAGEDGPHGQNWDLGVQGFRLDVQVPLPTPLAPLHWSFKLSGGNCEMFASELLLPALNAQLESQRMLNDLKQKLVEKDHAISKLMDKIDQTGMDLGLVFPGFSSARKGLNAQAATKIVPGIAKMDLPAWESRFVTENGRAANSITDAFYDSDTGKVLLSRPNHAFFDPHGEEQRSTDGDEHRTAGSGYHQPPNLPVHESTDAFEPSQRSVHPHSESLLHSNRRSMSLSSNGSASHVVKQKPYKIGNLGASHQPATHAKAPPAKDRRASNASSATASGSDSSSPPPSSKPKPKPASKLGALGGKKKASPAPALISSSPAPPSSNPSTPSRKLGTLGGRPRSATPRHTPINDDGPSQHQTQRTAAAKDSEATPTPSSSPTSTRKAATTSRPIPEPSPSPPPPILTAEQLAQQKRDELKRTLDTGGAGAGIKKKKRKF